MDDAPKARGKGRRLEGDESHQPPLGADLMNLLPDDALREIVARLPTKDAARTQVISPRWLPLWRSAPLNLDFSWVTRPSLAIDDRISSILSTHPGPVRRFAVPVSGFSDLDGWFRCPSLDHLQELEFHGCYIQAPPPSAFRFFSTLRVAFFARCDLPDDTVAAFCFPHLEQLTLDSVTVSEGALHGMLAGCPVLDCLLLDCISGCKRASIRSPTVRGVGVRVFHGLQELIIEDAPCLERLLVLDPIWGKIHVSVIAAPRLETVGCLSFGSIFEIGTTVFQKMRFDSLTTVVRSVKVLALNNGDLSLDMAIDFMRCFPCVEKLYIKAFGSGSKNAWRRKMLDPIECLDLHLKKIVLSGYRGNKSHIDFTMFFVLNGRVLELMRLEFLSREDRNEEWIEKQKTRLKLDNRVSRDARFYFTCDAYCSYFGSTSRAHEMLNADPFCT